MLVRQKVDAALTKYKDKQVVVELWTCREDNGRISKGLKECSIEEYELVILHVTGTVVLKMADVFLKASQSTCSQHLRGFGFNKDNCNLLSTWRQSAVTMSELKLSTVVEDIDIEKDLGIPNTAPDNTELTN